MALVDGMACNSFSANCCMRKDAASMQINQFSLRDIYRTHANGQLIKHCTSLLKSSGILCVSFDLNLLNHLSF